MAAGIRGPSLAQRVLALAGDDQSPTVHAAQLRSLQLALLLTVSFELTIYAAFRRVRAVVNVSGAFDRQPLAVAELALPLLLGLSLLAVVFARSRRARRWGAVGAAVAMAVVTVVLLPNTPNHYPMLTLAFGMLALCDPDDAAEQEIALHGLRWLFLIVLFAAGLQKVLYGLYFHGEYFAYRIATDVTFARPFEWLMPASEIERLRSLGGMVAGAGPYRSTWWPLTLVSNATYWIEMALPIFLLLRRTRNAAIIATLVFFLGMEVAPREVFFGAVAVQMTLLFARRDWNRVLLPLWTVLFIVLTLLRSLLPGLAFS